MTYSEMVEEARRLGVKGIGRMKPETLAARIREADGDPAEAPEDPPEAAPPLVEVEVRMSLLRTSLGRHHHGDRIALPPDEASRLKNKGAVK